MSFEIWMSCWRDQECAILDRDEFERVFSGHVVVREPRFVRVRFPDGGGGDIYMSDGERCSGFTVNRPGGNDLLDAMVMLAGRTGSVIYWLGKPPCMAVTDVAVVPHLPIDMVQRIGPPITVRNGADLMEAIRGESRGTNGNTGG